MNPYPTRPTVLVVEDEEELRESVGVALQLNGYHVALAGDGAEALRYLRSRRDEPAPCLILLDLMMPGMDGAEFLERQGTDPDLARIPVVVLTAASDPRTQLKDWPPASVLRKPFDLKVLMARVHSLSDAPDPIARA